MRFKSNKIHDFDYFLKYKQMRAIQFNSVFMFMILSYEFFNISYNNGREHSITSE